MRPTANAAVARSIRAGRACTSGPTCAKWGPDGLLYVSSHRTNEIMRFDDTGARIGAEFLISTYTSGGQVDVNACCNADKPVRQCAGP